MSDPKIFDLDDLCLNYTSAIGSFTKKDTPIEDEPLFKCLTCKDTYNINKVCVLYRSKNYYVQKNILYEK